MLTLSEWSSAAVKTYLNLNTHRGPELSRLVSLLGENKPLHDRRTLPGHVTASGIIYDPAAKKLLLIHHKNLDRWLQPGGHVDADELPPVAARREIAEEVGLTGLAMLSPSPEQIEPIDIDSHDIPANPKKQEPSHTHHDFRFVFVADSSAAMTTQEDEVIAAKWFDLDDPAVTEALPRIAAVLKSTPLYPVSDREFHHE